MTEVYFVRHAQPDYSVRDMIIEISPLLSDILKEIIAVPASRVTLAEVLKDINI